MGNVNSEDYWGSQIPRLIQHGFGERLTVRSVKLFLDGWFRSNRYFVLTFIFNK
jgi:hypothetical protein